VRSCTLCFEKGVMPAKEEITALSHLLDMFAFLQASTQLSLWGAGQETYSAYTTATYALRKRLYREKLTTQHS
jgi:hypothetical protein